MSPAWVTAVLLVAIGGAGGAVLRHLIDLGVAARVNGDFPWGILAANVAGSFLLGLTLPHAPPTVALVLGVGLCGALTTYSTVAANVWGLIEERRPRRAGVVLASTVIASVAAAASGTALSGLL